MKFNNITPIQIRFNDIDLAGHVYNAKFPEFFDLARIGYFKEVLGDLINWNEPALVIASIKIDYHTPVYLDDKIEITSNVISMGEKSFKMFQTVKKEGSLEPVATGKTVMVCFDFQKRESKKISEKWREKFTYFEPELIVK